MNWNDANRNRVKIRAFIEEIFADFFRIYLCMIDGNFYYLVFISELAIVHTHTRNVFNSNKI